MNDQHPTQETLIGRRAVQVLNTIYRHGGSVLRGEMSAQSGLEANRLHEVLQKLRAIGLVASGRNHVELTDAGFKWCSSNRADLVDAIVAQGISKSPCSVFHLAQFGRQSALDKSNVLKPTQPTGE